VTRDDRPGDVPPPPPPAPEGAKGAEDAAAADRRAGRDRRAGADRRRAQVPVERERRAGERRASPDRRDTAGKRGGEYDLDPDILEFIAAVNAFKERTGKVFPTWSDLIGVLRGLGWEKRPRA
jgi:hypothetical protein